MFNVLKKDDNRDIYEVFQIAEADFFMSWMTSTVAPFSCKIHLKDPKDKTMLFINIHKIKIRAECEDQTDGIEVLSYAKSRATMIIFRVRIIKLLVHDTSWASDRWDHHRDKKLFFHKWMNELRFTSQASMIK